MLKRNVFVLTLFALATSRAAPALADVLEIRGTVVVTQATGLANPFEGGESAMLRVEYDPSTPLTFAFPPCGQFLQAVLGISISVPQAGVDLSGVRMGDMDPSNFTQICNDVPSEGGLLSDTVFFSLGGFAGVVGGQEIDIVAGAIGEALPTPGPVPGLVTQHIQIPAVSMFDLRSPDAIQPVFSATFGIVGDPGDPNDDGTVSFILANRAIVLASDGFDDVPIQNDDVGADVAGVPDPVFSVTTDGEAPGLDNVVVSVTGPLAISTSIDAEGENQLWTFESVTGLPSGPDNLILTASLPGQAENAVAGPFAELFATPQDLNGATFSASVRASAIVPSSARGQGCNPADPTTVRCQAEDLEGNMAESAPMEVDSVLEPIECPLDDETLTPTGGALEFDLSAVVRLALAFGATQAKSACAQAFAVDDAMVVLAPEPARAWLELVGLAVVGVVARQRRAVARA